MDVTNRNAVDGLVYKMTRKTRGQFIIINNKKFSTKTGMSERKGSDLDAAGLASAFTKLGFQCKIHNNKTCQEMREIMQTAGSTDHTDADCFGCAILSHGDETYIFGTDDVIKPQDLFAPLKGDKCPSLVLKPKLFFIQACRGDKFDAGAEAYDEVDGSLEFKCVRVPIEADCLYAYSTVPGYFSWRNTTNGSCFIQALCKVINEWGSRREIMGILTRVNHMVAYEFESNASNFYQSNKKQIPSIVSQLTKRLYFPEKKTTV